MVGADRSVTFWGMSWNQIPSCNTVHPSMSRALHQQYPSHTLEKAIRVAVRRDLKEMASREIPAFVGSSTSTNWWTADCTGFSRARLDCWKCNRLAYWSWGYQDISPNTLWALAGLTKFTKINGFQGSLQISGPACHSSTVSWMLSEPPTQSCHP